VFGPWSLATSRSFWEGFTPSRLAAPADDDSRVLRAVFLGERDWRRAEVGVRQDGGTATLTLRGHGDLDAAAEQVRAFLSLDVDARGWPDVGDRDPVIADAQRRLPGLRPCGFHSPYEAAAWSVLSQRIRMVQAARLREDLIARHGEDGAFPAPAALLEADLDLPGRKAEYLTPSRGPRWTGGSRTRLCALWTRRTRWRRYSRSGASDRSPPSWWCCAAPTPPMPCPATRPGSPP